MLPREPALQIAKFRLVEPHLFSDPNGRHEPLAARMRPRTLDEFVGQRHIVGPGRLLRRAIQADQLSSLIFSGPPGTGKTTLARVIANSTKAHFIAINAVLAGVKDIRESIEGAKNARRIGGRKTILFVDEVHRFNKAQQDALLPHVESGLIILIGATTENPYFEVNKALVSRSRIFLLRPLEAEDIRETLLRAISDSERGYGQRNIEVAEDALEHIVQMAGGDARSALNALELAVETTPINSENGTSVKIGLSEAEESIQRRAVLYDKDGDAHYDTISAFIKSLRGSDPDAALYWMAKMLYAGEDPRFIFRRMLILASEDVGLADPKALGIIASAAQAYDYVGLPEGQFHLAQACLYLATAPKSNSTMTYFDVLAQVGREREDEVPNHLKDPARDGEGFGHGQGYKYPHAYREHWVAQQYLPESLRGKIFYTPSDSGYEADIRDRVARNREAQLAADAQTGDWVQPQGNENRWLERALNATGEILNKVREEIFALAAPTRDALVLDLSGGSGFLSWEALRRCPEGGVWTRCRDLSEQKALEAWSQRLGPFGEPVFFTASTDSTVDYLLGLTDPPCFQRIVSLDGLSAIERPESTLVGLLRLMETDGVWVAAESDRAEGPFLHEFLASGEFAPELWQRLSSIGRDSEGSAMNDLQTAWEEAVRPTSVDLRVLKREFMGNRQFTRAQVFSWFTDVEAPADERSDRKKSAYLTRLKQNLSQSEWAHLKSIALQSLPGRKLAWKQCYRFFRLQFS